MRARRSVAPGGVRVVFIITHRESLRATDNEFFVLPFCFSRSLLLIFIESGASDADLSTLFIGSFCTVQLCTCIAPATA